MGRRGRTAGRALGRGAAMAGPLWLVAAGAPALAQVQGQPQGQAQASPPPASQAAATEAAPPTTPASAAGSNPVGEVVVTATRRAESIQKVPLAVSVLSADSLQASGAKSIGDYLYTIPGVSYAKDGAEGRGAVTIRGVNTGALTTPLVANYVDEVPIGASTRFADGIAAFDQRLLDLDRVEVLKGPQGTLFGASAMGGVLRYITRRPRLGEADGSASVDVNGTQNGRVGYTVNGLYNLPLGDTAAVRVAGFHEDDSGYVDATGSAGGKHVNSTESYGGRVSLLWKPVEKLSVNLSAQYQTLDQDGTSFVSYNTNGQPVADPLTRVDLRRREPYRQINQLYTGTIDYDLGFATFTSITGYQHSRLRNDGDFSGVYGVFAPFFGPNPISLAYSDREARLGKWTQEGRLVSPTGGFFDWIAGVFYTHESGGIGQDIVQRYGNGAPTTTLLYGPGAGFQTTYEETAGYVTLNAHPLKALTVTGGVRVAHNDIDVEQINGGILAPQPNSFAHTSETPVTWLASARYEFLPDNSVYFRAATGYRAGGPNPGLVDPTTGQPLTNSPVYQSDNLISYELGYKGDLAHGLLRVDAAIFRIDWHNIQQTIFAAGSAALSNFGNAQIDGAELGLSLRPTRGLTFGWSMSLLDPKLETDSPVGLQARAGARLPNTAKFTGDLTARYERPLTDRVKGYIELDQLFDGRRNSSYDLRTTNFPSSPNFVLPAFNQTDVNLGVEFDRYKVGFYVRNAFNARGLLNADTTQTPYGLPVYVTPIRPRVVGATITATF